MARAFPRSTFHGWDVSEHALARAEENRRAAGAPNIAFHDARREPLPPDARFALVTTFDCLHDMTDPAGTMRHFDAGYSKAISRISGLKQAELLQRAG